MAYHFVTFSVCLFFAQSKWSMPNILIIPLYVCVHTYVYEGDKLLNTNTVIAETRRVVAIKHKNLK